MTTSSAATCSFTSICNRRETATSAAPIFSSSGAVQRSPNGAGGPFGTKPAVTPTSSSNCCPRRRARRSHAQVHHLRKDIPHAGVFSLRPGGKQIGRLPARDDGPVHPTEPRRTRPTLVRRITVVSGNLGRRLSRLRGYLVAVLPTRWTGGTDRRRSRTRRCRRGTPACRCGTPACRCGTPGADNLAAELQRLRATAPPAAP